MHPIKNESVIHILQNTMNYVDQRLIDHGIRVAYMLYRMLIESDITYTKEELRDLCILAMLHDFGAYKTEEIDQMVRFEAFGIGEHSIYGYLILKYFSPRSKYADVILYHHASCDEVMESADSETRFIAQCISLVDRADVFAVNGKSQKSFIRFITKQRGIFYFANIIDLFVESGVDITNVGTAIQNDERFNDIFYQTFMPEKDVLGYFNLLVNALEFRSRQTALHSDTTVFIAEYIANKLHLSEDEIFTLKMASLLHDIGKVNVPLTILESTKYLDEKEMEIMKQHVFYTNEILQGNIDESIRRVAVYHHEKINGSGYLEGIKLTEDYKLERILAVADILSALLGKRSYKNSYGIHDVCLIVKDMAEKNLIDSSLVEMMASQCDDLLEKMDVFLSPILRIYESIQVEFADLKKKYNAKETMM